MIIKKHLKIIFLVIFLALIVSYFAVSFYVASAMTTPLSLQIDTSPTVISKSYSDVSFKTTDGLLLKGWFFEGATDKAIVMVTGLIANRVNTEYLGLIIAKELIDKGYNVLLYDTRAHGQSDGKRVGYGSLEGLDVVGAVNFVKSRGFNPRDIGIIGDSTGAISTLMVIEQLKDVGAIVLDTPATDFARVISDRLWKEKGVPTFFDPAIFFFDKVVFGVDINSIRPIDKIGLDQNRKFLFLHGALDQTIPPINSQELLQKANPQSKRVVFPKGEHIATFRSDPDLYRQEVYSFLDTELNK